MLRHAIIFIIFILLSVKTYSGKVLFEEVQLTGIENPVNIAVSPDGLQMVIIDQPEKNICIVKQASRPYLESTWSVATAIPQICKLIRPGIRIDGFCFSPDGTTLYFAADFQGSMGGMDIFFCTLGENGEWSQPQNIGTPVNSKSDENYPSLSGNNRNFYFTRKIDIKALDNFSCWEIWMSRIDSMSTKWLMPEKLNTEINTGGISCPKVYDDNYTFFFSRVTDTKEKWDIFWTKRMREIHWYLPSRIDTLCSKESDICPIFCKAEKKLYFIMNQGSDRKPKGTIYKTDIEPRFMPDKTIKAEGTVWDSYNNCPVKANILVTDPVSGKICFYQESDSKTGKWKILLNIGNNYVFNVWKDGFSHEYQLLTKEKTNSDFSLNFTVFPTTKISINVYDKELLSPLNASLSVTGKNDTEVVIYPQLLAPGRQQFELPIGTDYTIKAQMKNFYPNSLSLGLSTIVLFDHFVRDIELEPIMRKVEFYVTSEEDNLPLEAKIDLKETEHGKHYMPEPTAGQPGLSFISLREGTKYGVDISGVRGYAFKHVDIDLDNDKTLKRLNIELKKLKKKVAIRLDNINFEFNSADLMESSYDELNRLVQLMKENPEIKVEIRAHTDDIGSDKYNFNLSGKRARSVLQYLVYSGVPDVRLVSNGYGETIPLVPNTSDENRALNRRVEMEIVGFMYDTNGSTENEK